jgi:hypothetical protein
MPTRVLAVAVLCFALPVVPMTAEAKPNKKPGRGIKPRAVLPPRNVQLFWHARHTVAGRVAMRARSVSTFQPAQRLGQTLVTPHRMKLSMELLRPPRRLKLTMEVLHRLEAVGVRTVAMRVGGQPPRRLLFPYWDLKSPLSRGASWRFVANYPIPVAFGITEAKMRFVTTVIAVGRHFEAKGEVISGCFEVEARGISVSPHQVRCLLGRRSTRLAVRSRRLWCPKRWYVRHNVVTTTVDAKGRPNTCHPAYHADTKLVRVKTMRVRSTAR